MDDIVELEEVFESIPSRARAMRKAKRRSQQKTDEPNYISPREAYGIDSWICGMFADYPGKIGPFDFVKKSVTRFFGEHPSVVVTNQINILGAVKGLKKAGSVHGIYSEFGQHEKPASMSLYIETSDGILFAHFEGIEYLDPKGFTGYSQEDLVCGKIPMGVLGLFYKSNNESVYPLLNEISKSEMEFKEESYIDMIIATQHGLALRSITLEPPDSFDFNLHYGEGFEPFHQKLLDRLDQKDKGIVMFHGPPGTGKTHYIRSLIPKLIAMDKRVILIPKHVLSNLESPHFNTFMIENFCDERIVFIIEDAESIVAKRESSGGFRSELVSTLLNVTDGILNDIFNIQVILTFNTELSSIDEALLRKGRLISKYEFGNLDKKAAKKLGDSIGVKISGAKDSYSLADIYALKESVDDEVLINQNSKKEKGSVGF